MTLDDAEKIELPKIDKTRVAELRKERKKREEDVRKRIKLDSLW